MTYKYDVFLSYKRQPLAEQWYLGLVQHLEHWLSQELGREVEVFRDTEDIRTGQRWRNRISDSLKRSRCLVCMWSPLYFESEWCVAELESFIRRVEAFDEDLIVPARYYDGDLYPDAAKEFQSPDFSEYTVVAPTFWQSPHAMDFEIKHLRKFVLDIADAIRAAPEYSEDFPVVEAPDANLMISRKKIGRPGAE